MNANAIPDLPQSFGCKMAWFAIPTENSPRVISAFGFGNVRPANWEFGVRTVYSSLRYAFITPPVDGWTLVLGLGFPSFDIEEKTQEILALIDAIGVFFPDFCYFGTHGAVDYQAWVRVSGRKIQRAYAFLGERGETLCEMGNRTAEEIALGCDFFDERSEEAASADYFERSDLRFPGEVDVMRISAAWTISTQTLHERIEKGNGFLAEFR